MKAPPEATYFEPCGVGGMVVLHVNHGNGLGNVYVSDSWLVPAGQLNIKICGGRTRPGVVQPSTPQAC